MRPISGISRSGLKTPPHCTFYRLRIATKFRRPNTACKLWLAAEAGSSVRTSGSVRYTFQSVPSCLPHSRMNPPMSRTIVETETSWKPTSQLRDLEYQARGRSWQRLARSLCPSAAVRSHPLRRTSPDSASFLAVSRRRPYCGAVPVLCGVPNC